MTCLGQQGQLQSPLRNTDTQELRSLSAWAKKPNSLSRNCITNTNLGTNLRATGCALCSETLFMSPLSSLPPKLKVSKGISNGFLHQSLLCHVCVLFS